MLAYGGWSEISTLSAEARDGRKGMVRALIASVLLISGLYIAVNWALLSGLGFAGLSASEAPAAELMSRAFGPWAGPLIATAIVIAVATSINATILTGGRTLYACARDWLDLAGLSAWTGDRGGPRAAIWLQSLIALILVGVGAWLGEGFEAMVDFTSPVFWIFMTLSGLAVIVLRVRQPDLPRPFRVPLYPLPPIVFTFSSALMGLSASVYAAGLVSVDAGETSPFGVGVRPAAVIGGVTLLAGVLVLYVLQRRAARPSRDSPE
jgi:amino acid transporter